MLRHRAEGLTIAEIGDRCFLSRQTVKNHLQNAVRKLDLVRIDETGRVNRACYLLGRFEVSQQGQVIDRIGGPGERG